MASISLSFALLVLRFIIENVHCIVSSAGDLGVHAIANEGESQLRTIMKGASGAGTTFLSNSNNKNPFHF